MSCAPPPDSGSDDWSADEFSKHDRPSAPGKGEMTDKVDDPNVFITKVVQCKLTRSGRYYKGDAHHRPRRYWCELKTDCTEVKTPARSVRRLDFNDEVFFIATDPDEDQELKLKIENDDVTCGKVKCDLSELRGEGKIAKLYRLRLDCNGRKHGTVKVKVLYSPSMDESDIEKVYNSSDGDKSDRSTTDSE